MDGIKNMSKRTVWAIALIVSSLVVALGIGIYFANAAAGGGGGDIGGGDIAGTNFYSYAKWDDVPVYDEASGEWEPGQGWESDSVNYFWRELNNEIDGWVGLRFDSGQTASYQRKVFDEACYEALARVKDRQDQKARIVAVSVFFSNSSAQGGNVALMAQYNERKYTDFFEEPTDYYENGSHNVLTDTYGNILDLEHEWWEPCDQPGSLPGERWMDYIWRITGEDTCGSVNGNAPYSVIAIAVNEDMMAGVSLTLQKHITGEDAPDGSIEKLIYGATKDNDCYDLSGAKFQVFKEDGVTPAEARVIENGKPTGEKVPVIFTTRADGSTEEIYSVKRGEYWLREVQAPNKGFYKDTDGDGIRDELDDDTSFGKKYSINRGKVVVDGVELSPIGKFEGKDLFAFQWWDEPMNDPNSITVNKRDSLTGALTPMPEGNASTNGAQYRFAYYKGKYTKVDQLPGFNRTTGKVDWNYADSTALWETRSYTNAEGKRLTGMIVFGNDDPVEGTWKYNDGFFNICPLGTLAIVEERPPVGYKIDPRIYLYSVLDDGTHNYLHQSWNEDGSPGNGDWNPDFGNEWSLNGDRDDITTPW